MAPPLLKLDGIRLTFGGAPLLDGADLSVAPGDRIALVGDYDSSHLWAKLPSFRNITPQLVQEWNAFIELPDKQLPVRTDCACAVPR